MKPWHRTACLGLISAQFSLSFAASNTAPPPENTAKIFTQKEIAKHDKPKDCWVIINSNVYDMTSYIKKHCGSKMSIIKHCGGDASGGYGKFHGQDRKLDGPLNKMKVGVLAEHK